MEQVPACNLCDGCRVRTIDPEAGISRCEDCGYVFANPRPVFDDIESFYSRCDKYDVYLMEEKARDVVWQKRLRKMTTHLRPGTLLDVGAGTGQFLHHATSVYSEVCGTEVSESAVKLAKARYDLDLLQGDLCDIRFREGTAFDNITLFHVLEHVPQPKRLLERCSSLLRAGGVLYVAVPNELHSLRARWLRLKMRTRGWFRLSLAGYQECGIGRLGISANRLDSPGREVHLSYFTSGVLMQCLEECRFRVIENSLDPINMNTGLAYLRHQLYYLLSSAVLRVWKRNIYDTIWIAAMKKT